MRPSEIHLPIIKKPATSPRIVLEDGRTVKPSRRLFRRSAPSVTFRSAPKPAVLVK